MLPQPHKGRLMRNNRSPENRNVRKSLLLPTIANVRDMPTTRLRRTETRRDDINPLLDVAGVILTQIAVLKRPKVRAFPNADTGPEQPEPTSSFLYPALDEKG